MRGKDRAGYGQLRQGKKIRFAHHVAYELVKGPIPEGKMICHTCDMSECVNPAHLWAGTAADNQRDKAVKGRAVKRVTNEQVQEIRQAYAAGDTQVAIATRYGIHQGSVSAIVRGKERQHVPNDNPITKRIRNKKAGI